MRTDFGVKTWLYPQPVLIIGTYDDNNIADAMNAAWGGICGDNRISICLSRQHKTVKNILQNGAFTVSPATESCMAKCDYVGIVSANKVPNKVELSGLTVIKSKNINAPLFKELYLSFECRLISYVEQTELIFGEIVNMSVDSYIINDDGKIDPYLLKPIIYDPVNRAYCSFGEKVADAYFIGKSIINS